VEEQARVRDGASAKMRVRRDAAREHRDEHDDEE
jgi:hypothetical protein